MTKTRSKKNTWPAPYLDGSRAFELDFLRGLAIFLMIVQHTVFDLRVLFGVPGLEFESSFWVDDILRPLFLMVFLSISGISSTFSKDNVQRGIRLFFVALVLMAALIAIDAWIIPGIGVIYFNVLQVIAWSTLLYALLTRREHRMSRGGGVVDGALEKVRNETDVNMIVLAALFIFFGLTLPRLPELQVLRSWWLMPFGFAPPGVAFVDYMPFIPWSGFYLLGAVIGRKLYRERRTRFPEAAKTLVPVMRPFLWLGRRALIVYLLHQPLVYAFLTLLDRLLPIFPKS